MNNNPQRKFKLRAVKAGTLDSNNCEVCGGFCDPIHSQTESREYARPATGERIWLRIKRVYGHLNCLEKVRRESLQLINH